MLRPLRRLLATLVTAGSIVVGAPVAGHAAPAPAVVTAIAAPCSAPTLPRAYAAADAVFEGTIAHRVSARSSGTGRINTYVVDIRTYWKMPDASVKRARVQVPRNDPVVGTAPDDRYVFFVGVTGRQFAAPACGGVHRANDVFLRRLNAYYDSLGQPAQQEPGAVTPTFTKVADADPTSLRRLAAPGAAMVLVGLLGLVVVRRLGRGSAA